ncbi:MAG: glycosyltransferase [Candidatus Bathyarchaeota archaeon]|nr:glycosyltransferase [Candidatus Bathyarchaeota archaeon]HGJ66020.1 glycosyltransferase [bacterium]
MFTKPLVSIIIPCKIVDEYTTECIEGCKRLDYPNVEIILLPDTYVPTIDGIKIIATGPVAPGTKRNIGVAKSRGEICAFIDNDAYPRNDWLTNATKILEDPSVGGVGGPGITPPKDSLLQKASGLVMSSFMVGTLSKRYKTQNNFESDDIHSCNFIAPKSVILAAGGWNEKYWPGEDTLMCLGIRKLGKKLIESSEVVVYHHRRSLFKPHLKQVSRFGEHRGLFARKYPQNSAKITYFFPSVLILSLTVGLILSLLIPYFIYIMVLGLLVYLISCSIAAAQQVRSLKLFFIVWIGIIVTHITYGIYFLSGLLKRDLKR